MTETTANEKIEQIANRCLELLENRLKLLCRIILDEAALDVGFMLRLVNTKMVCCLMILRNYLTQQLEPESKGSQNSAPIEVKEVGEALKALAEGVESCKKVMKNIEMITPKH